MKTVLVVDDEDVIRSVIPKFLCRLPIGLTVLTAGNGAEAIDLLKSNHVDLILTDLNMPVMDGFELLAYIADKLPEIKKIVMTGLLGVESERKLSSLEISHIMIKPFNLRTMNEKILSLLGNDTARPAAAYSAQQYHQLKSALVSQVS